MQRNNIAQKYPRRAKLELVRWREIEGDTPIEIRRRAAEAWPELPAVHSRTWRSWSASAEYRNLRDEVVANNQRNEKLESLWSVVEGGGMDTMMQGTLYLLLQQAFEAANQGELNVKELTNLVRSVSTAQRAELARVQDERKQEIEQLEQEHEAEMAGVQGELKSAREEIDRLRELLAGAGIDPDGVKEQGGGLSAAALRQIEEDVKLL